MVVLGLDPVKRDMDPVFNVLVDEEDMEEQLVVRSRYDQVVSP